MPDPISVLALIVVGPSLCGVLWLFLKAVMRRQDEEEPQELSLTEAHRMHRSIERIARESGNA